jgi:hypothetical protein
MRHPMKWLALGLLLTAAGLAQKYTAEGELILPGDYRDWIFLSSGIGMTYSNTPNEHPRFGNVFVNPASYKAFLKTGSWPEKTILLIENRASGGNPSNKDGKFQTNLAGYEAHVKDSSRKGADPGGWLFYIFGEDSQRAKPFERQKVCTDCHNKNASTETTFVQFYPTLIDIAKAHHTYREPPAE